MLWEETLEQGDFGSERCPAVIWDAAVRLSLVVALVIMETMQGLEGISSPLSFYESAHTESKPLLCVLEIK